MTTQSIVEKIMTTNPITIFSEESLSKVIEKMGENKFDHLPVVDRWNNLLGIISKTDLYNRTLSLSRNTTGKFYTEKTLFVSSAEDVMTVDPVSVTRNESLEFIIDLLLKEKFHALPVVEGKKLKGIITSKDILAYLTNQVP